MIVALQWVRSLLVLPFNSIATICADCDQYYDWKGCDAGLVCGTDNCHKYHTLGYKTGISAGSDCCEREFGKNVMIWARTILS